MSATHGHFKSRPEPWTAPIASVPMGTRGTQRGDPDAGAPSAISGVPCKGDRRQVPLLIPSTLRVRGVPTLNTVTTFSILVPFFPSNVARVPPFHLLTSSYTLTSILTSPHLSQSLFYVSPSLSASSRNLSCPDSQIFHPSPSTPIPNH